MVIKVTVSHFVALLIGAVLAVSATALAGGVHVESGPTHADLVRINSTLASLNDSTTSVGAAVQHGLFNLCRLKLAVGINDTQTAQLWCG